jgi:hypothetical protein
MRCPVFPSFFGGVFVSEYGGLSTKYAGQRELAVVGFGDGDERAIGAEQAHVAAGALGGT